MRLSEVKTGEEVIIAKILGHGAFRKRVMEMGFVRGKQIKVEMNAPLHDPIKYKILDYEISLRRSEAAMIEVIPKEEYSEITHTNTISDVDMVSTLQREDKTINIALIGNPNCGKTSLFNFVSGLHEHVGNYSGVTVDAKSGYVDYKGYHFVVVDLPGTYSLSAYSPEELYVRRYLKEEIPDVIVNVVVASNLERNLYLSTELIDMDRSMVIALNMFDELESKGATIDYKSLGKMIGVPIVPTISKSGKGIDDLFDSIIKVYEDEHDTVRHVHINLGNDIESAIKIIKDEIKRSIDKPQQFSPRYLAIKLLERDNEVENLLYSNPDYKKWIKIRDAQLKLIEDTHNEDISSTIASEKYGFIAGALKETFTEPEVEKIDSTKIIDTFVTSKLFGFPIFIFLMWLMFWATFELGAYPMQWIESLVALISTFINGLMAPGPIKDLLVDGIIGGVGGVIVFLPNILILYFFISFMEDSGYMARAAFIMDRIMHKIGLHGKSFIPLIMGFGCNVPAIMATRSIESKSSRIITMLINPFMSCSARLPIYILLVGIFFPKYSALVFLFLYLLGILIAVITARLLRKFYFKKDETPFVMELPPYRIPTLKVSLRHMWLKGEQYIRKMGGIILLASIVIWALSYFPRDIKYSDDQMSTEQIVEQQQNSYLASIGKFIAPAVEPLGLNWKMSIALISGTSAKEIVVSTINVLYPASEGNSSVSLSERLSQINPQTGAPNITALQALSFMVFVLLYFPCIATITAIIKESGSWKYGFFAVFYNTSVAWVFSFIVYQVGRLFV
ncbi:MAG: ferrous iron transport protein B [Muribaculaceae bacterium]|nr:ferrous iron transport protein B [Muribaculaceae bacterium]